MVKSFTDQATIFQDETVLYDDWTPDELPEREAELDRLHDVTRNLRSLVGRQM